MPIIRVDMFPGRDVAQKRALVKALTEAFVKTAGGNPNSVEVLISDVGKENWGIGGELAKDRFPDD